MSGNRPRSYAEIRANHRALVRIWWARRLMLPVFVSLAAYISALYPVTGLAMLAVIVLNDRDILLGRDKPLPPPPTRE